MAADLGVGAGGSPVPGASAAARATPSAKAGGAAGAPPSSDFAADLARLVALLGAGRANDAAPNTGEGSADTGAEAAVASDAGDAVDALCAEVALAVPGGVPTGAPPSSAPDLAPEDGGDRAPSRTLQVLLTPPGAAVAADHRSAQAPEAQKLPTLPLLPAAAAGAAAFTVAPDPTVDATARVEAATAGSAETTAAAPAGTALPLDAALRPAAHAPATTAPHVVAGTIVDTLQPQAPRQLAEAVAWHVPAQGAAEVQIRLNPEELGPLEVQLKLDGDKVSVRFDLADERVRDVVQTSLPSLSSLLASRGLQLDQAQVFAQQRGQQGSPQQQAPWSSARHDADDTDAAMSVTAASRPLIRRGLLDDYA